MDQDYNQAKVERLYNTYPFPPDPLSDDLPPGYNWRWNWQAAHNFALGEKPKQNNIRILDAGCGTGVSTEYLIYLNPTAEVVAIDLSEKALAIAQQRSERSGVLKGRSPKVTFQNIKIEQADKLEGEFNLINCVGVLHHLPDPIAGIKSLAAKLAPGGLLHVFVYADLGRWEIQLMQKAIKLLQKEKEDYQAGVSIGRDIFASLPENNRLLKREKERWALENHWDQSFADMYVHPLEFDYSIKTLFELIDSANLEFLGFSNPQYWQLERLLGKSPQLMELSENLSLKERYQLIELLDPDITHYEFFLGRPPLSRTDWSDDLVLKNAVAEVHPCLYGWPEQSFLDYEYQPVSLSDAQYNFMRSCDGRTPIAEILGELNLDNVRSLQDRQLIMLSKADQESD